jgi:hypothetical protein
MAIVDQNKIKTRYYMDAIETQKLFHPGLN